MNRSVLVDLGLVTAITTALAQSADPIVERKNLMKGNGAAAKIGTQMVKGEVPFDLGTAKNCNACHQTYRINKS
jgi:cytochrome c556